MVCDYGMSEKLGPLSYGQGEHEIFLGKDFSQRKDFSEHTAQVIDSEVRAIIMRNFERAKVIIQEKREILTCLAEALLVRETLEANDVVLLMNGQVLPPKPPPAESLADPLDTPPDPGLAPALSPA